MSLTLFIFSIGRFSMAVREYSHGFFRRYWISLHKVHR
nr:MAG TPA: hypothetical protein [Caudoviricetes sp.]